MGCKYVKDFEFPGGSKVAVKPYMRGGPVRKPAAKAERAEAKQSKAGDCACHGGSAHAMKKGGKAKKSPAKKRSASKEPKLSAEERQMAEGILSQMAAQAQQTGRIPGIPGGGVGGNARGFPPASQEPMIPQQAPMMKRGGSKK